jgi:chromosomal replication initiation ATPase DnaA
MMVGSKQRRLQLEPREHCVLKLFIAENQSVKSAAQKIGMNRQVLGKIAENRRGSEQSILYLRQTLTQRGEELFASRILKLIALYWNIDISLLTSRESRRQPTLVVEPKQAACYLLAQHTQLPYEKIAEKLGYNNKQIVSFGLSRTEEIMAVDTRLRNRISDIEKNIIY